MSGVEIVELFLAALMIVGALFSLIGMFGLIRLPDIYNRTHAATKVSTLGVICILVAATCFFWIRDGILNPKLLLGILFVFLTAPVGGHLIGRAAYRSGVALWGKSVQDDLRQKLNKREER